MTERDFCIRRAVAADSERLTGLAHASKRYWKYPEEWIRRWKSALTITEIYVVENQVFVGELETRSGERERRLGGFYALTHADDVWDLAHFWIHPDFIGRGLGRALFSDAVARLAVTSPGSDMIIESDPYAESFYLRMGAARMGTVSTDWGGLKRTLPLLRYATAGVPPDS